MSEKKIDMEEIIKSRKNELLRIMCETELNQSEIGCAVCAHDNDILPFEWSVGTEKTLKIKRCEQDSEEIGKIHTHPSQWLPDLSLADKVISISEDNDFTVILHKDQGKKGWYNATIYNIDKQDKKYEKLKKAADAIIKNEDEASRSDYEKVDKLFEFVADKKHLFAEPPIQ